MCTSLCSILSVDKAIEVLPYLRGMGHDDLDVVLLEVDDRIQGLLGDVLLEEVC